MKIISTFIYSRLEISYFVDVDPMPELHKLCIFFIFILIFSYSNDFVAHIIFHRWAHMSYPNYVEYLSSSLELYLNSLQLLISISILIPRAPLSSPYCPSYNLLSPSFKSPQLYQCPKHKKKITQTLINWASPKYKSICLTRIRARFTKNHLISSNQILTKI